MSSLNARQRWRQLQMAWVIAGLCLMAGLASLWWQNRAAGGATGALLFPAFSGQAGEAAAIAIRSGDGAWSLRKTGGVWTVSDRDGYPADPALVEGLLAFVGQADTSLPRTSDPTRFEVLGVANPEEFGDGTRVTITDQSGRTLAGFLIGQRRAPLVYLRRAGEAQVYRLVARLPDLRDPGTWVDTHLIDVDPRDILAVEGAGADGVISIVRRPDGGLAPQAAGEGNAASTALALLPASLRPVDMRRVIPSGTPWRSVRWLLRGGGELVLTVLADRQWITVQAEAGPDATSQLRETASALNRKAEGWQFRLRSDQMAVLLAPGDQIMGLAVSLP